MKETLLQYQQSSTDIVGNNHCRIPYNEYIKLKDEEIEAKAGPVKTYWLSREEIDRLLTR